MNAQAQRDVKTAFEAYTKAALQAMLNYAAPIAGIDRMWVYTDMGYEAIETAPFFRHQGDFVDHGDLAEMDPDGDHDQFELMRSFKTTGLKLVRACRAAGAVPERIITTYDPQTGDLESQWDYEGVKIGEDDTYGRARDRWIRSMGGKPIFAKE